MHHSKFGPPTTGLGRKQPLATGLYRPKAEVHAVGWIVNEGENVACRKRVGDEGRIEQAARPTRAGLSAIRRRHGAVPGVTSRT